MCSNAKKPQNQRNRYISLKAIKITNKTFKGVWDDIHSQVEELRKATCSDMCYQWNGAARVCDILAHHMTTHHHLLVLLAWKWQACFLSSWFLVHLIGLSPMNRFLKTDHILLPAFIIQVKPHTCIMCLWLKSVLWAVSDVHPSFGLQKPTTYDVLLRTSLLFFYIVSKKTFKLILKQTISNSGNETLVTNVLFCL